MSENSAMSVRFELGFVKVEVSRNLLGVADLFRQLFNFFSSSLERNERHELQSAHHMLQLLLHIF
jgi:hypothetical protein